MAELEQQLLQAVNDAGSIEDTGAFAEKLQVEHNAVVGVIKSLLAAEMIATQVRLCSRHRARGAGTAPARVAVTPVVLPARVQGDGGQGGPR